jgi:hypothetical protein
LSDNSHAAKVDLALLVAAGPAPLPPQGLPRLVNLSLPPALRLGLEGAPTPPPLTSGGGDVEQGAPGSQEQVEQGPALPFLHGPGVLAALPPGDLGSLEVALRRFLDDLERARQGLGGDDDRRGLYLWVVAAASMAAACEIARRQLRRPAVALPPDHPFIG